MISLLKGIFTSGGAIEKIASEWIETKKETAEADALMVKTLDPNGMMRRELSRRVAALYTLYVVVTLCLLVCESFGVGPMNGEQLAVSVATDKIKDLFAPITTLFGAIVTASFGVNYANVKSKS